MFKKNWEKFKENWLWLPFGLRLWLSVTSIGMLTTMVLIIMNAPEEQKRQQTQQALEVYCRETCMPNDLDRVYGKQCYCKADIFIRPIVTKQ